MSGGSAPPERVATNVEMLNAQRLEHDVQGFAPSALARVDELVSRNEIRGKLSENEGNCGILDSHRGLVALPLRGLREPECHHSNGTTGV